MSKHKTTARLQAIAAARDEAQALIREAKSLEPLSVVAPRDAFERICIGCGAKVIPGLTNHCNH